MWIEIGPDRDDDGGRQATAARSRRLRVHPLAGLMMRTRWFRRLTGFRIVASDPGPAALHTPGEADAAGDASRCERELTSDERRILRSNALFSALMRSTGQWGR